MLDEPVDTICGYVKGKNASGGDTEEMPFLYIIRDDRDGEAYLVDGRVTWRKPCTAFFANRRRYSHATSIWITRSWCCSMSPSRRLRSGAWATPFALRFRWHRDRQHGDRLDLQKRALPSQTGNRDGRARGSLFIGQVAVAHLAEDRQILHVGEVIVELHDVLDRPPTKPAHFSDSRKSAPPAGGSRR